MPPTTVMSTHTPEISALPPAYEAIPSTHQHVRYHTSWTSNCNLTNDSLQDSEKGAILHTLPPNTRFSTASNHCYCCMPALRLLHNYSHSYPSSTITRLHSFLLVFAFIALFVIGPLWALNFIATWKHQLKLISVLVLIFGSSLSVHTTRVVDVLGSTAAYAAVLVVFMHLGNNGNVNGRGIG